MKSAAHTTPRWEMIALILILSMAGFLRLWNLGSSSFGYDSALIANMATNFLETGQPPLQGMVSSVGVQNPALAVYLFSLPVALQRDPRMMIVFVALLNTAAVGGVYWLGKRYWSRSVGLIAALLFGVSPWAVFFGRQIWPPSLIPPANVLMLAVLLAWVVKRSSWALAATLVTQAALIQLNFSAIALVPMVAVLLALELWGALRNRELGRFLRMAAIGIGLSVLLYVPYLIAEAQNGWPSIRQLAELTRAPSRYHPQAFDMALMTVGGRNIHSLVGAQRHQEFLVSLADPAYRLDRVLEGLVVLAILYLVLRLWRERRENLSVRRDGVLLLWLASVVLFFLRSGTDVRFHYFVSLYPVPFFVLAIAVTATYGAIAVGRNLKRVARLMLVAVFGLFLIWQSYVSLSIYRFLETHDTPGGWSTPLSILAAVAANIEHYAGLFQSSDVIVVCTGSEPRWDECPAVFHYLARRSPNSVSFLDRNDRSIWTHAADTETLVVLTPGEGLVATELPQFATPILGASVPLREHAGEFRFFRIHNYYQEVAQQLEGAASPDSAIILVGRHQEAELRRFYRGSLPVYELPETGRSADETIARLEQLADRYSHLIGLFRVAEDVDPAGVITAWLNDHTYLVEDDWFGPVRRSTYVSLKTTALDRPDGRMGAEFGDGLRLAEYSLSSSKATAGDVLLLRLAWEILSPTDSGHMVFIHLLDKEGHVVAQRDIPLMRDSYAKRLGSQGYRVESRVGLGVPSETKPGEYRLLIGVYNPQTGQRLPVEGKDHLDAGTIWVSPDS